MIRECPKHKSSEKMLANLKTRYIKLKEKIERQDKTKKGSVRKGVKKEGVQVVLVGKTNVGKSSLISAITNARSGVANYKFTTKKPVVGMMSYGGVEFQIIDIPAFGSDYYDKGIVHTADIILMLVDNLEQINELRKELDKEKGKQIIAFNKTDLLDENEKRKISANLQSKKYNFAAISVKTKEGINELKEKLLQNSGKIRVFTKEPGKPKTEKPIILPPGSTLKDVAEKILKGFSKNVKETKIWGPSSKFSGQIIGLNHILKDLDVVEFKTR